MKRLLLLLALPFLFTGLNAQIYTHPTVGLQNTYVGTCEVNTCSGTYYDNGGAAGNYSLNINNVYRTFCPSTPNQCIRITFNTFNLEAPFAGFCYDLLSVVDSPTQNGPILGSGCGTSLQGMTFTSNNPSGCISVRFYSDNTVTAAGWNATISCGPCGVGAAGGPNAGTNADCQFAQFVCNSGTPITAGTQGPGIITDACVAGCVLAENYSNWYIVNVTTPGLMGMTITPNPVGADYDFALFSGTCGSLGAPLRCSYAANTGNTGMVTGAGDFSEDVTGNGWVESVNLPVGTYYLLVNQWDDFPGATFTLNFTGTAVVGLPAPSPVTANPTPCANSILQLNGPTIPGATYNWSGPGGWTSSLQNPTRNPVVAGTYTLTYTSNGCTSPPTNVVVTIPVDNTPPTITCPANITNFTSAGVCNRSIATPNPTTADNCGVTRLTWTMTGATTGSSPATGINNLGTQTFNLGVTTVTYTVADAAGNTASCSFTVTITDNINPTISCPANISNFTTAGTCSRSIATPNPTTGDNCSIASLTWTMTGATTGSSPGTGINNLGTQTFNLGTTTVTYTITDGSGNTATCSYTVTITDNIAPTITCPANISNTVTAGTCSRSIATPNPTTGDNCSVATLTWTMSGATTGSSPGAGINNLGTQTFNLGTTTVTYTVTDGAGLTATCSFTVTITDNIAPTITCPANIANTATAGSCNLSIATPNPTTGDNCSVASLTWVMTGATTGSSPGTGINNLGTQTFNTGTTTVTYTVTDGSGLTSTCSFTVTITDNILPTITCPANITNFTSAGTCSRSIATPNPTTADNCGVTRLTWTMTGATTGSSPATGINNLGTQTFNLGVTTVTYTVADAAGNTATCSFTVTITDNIAPTITCPANQTGSVNTSCQFTLPNYVPMATANDNCSVASVTQSPAAGTLVSAGTTVVTLTVTDGSGNTNTCNFNVVVSDATPPTVTCPPTQTINLNASCAGTIGNYVPLVTSSDNCGVASVTQSPAAGSPVSGVGTTVVTITVTDINGLTSTCNFNVNRVDVTPPTITCPGNQTASANASCQFTMTNYTGMATTSDNCSAVTVTQSPLPGATVSGTQTVTLTATDASGNSSTCTFQVVVTDNTPPTLTCPGNQTGTVNASCQFALPNYTTMATATDNCTATPTITQVPAPGTLVGTGTTVVTLTAADANGNTSPSCTFNVVVTDITPPTVACPAAQTINLNASCTGTVGNYVPLVTSSDNCGVASVAQSPAAGTSVSGVGTTVITITVTDINGLTSTCTFNANRVDVTPPTITCPGNQTASANASCQFTMADYTGMATTSDNCSAVTVTQSPLAGATVSGTQTVTLTATDASGNSSTCTFQVVVTDNTAPTLTCPGNQTGTVNASCQFALPDYTTMATATDNCTATPTITQAPSPGTLVGTGTTVVTLTATDANGNTSPSCTFNVVVTDNIAPVITCPANQNLVVNSSCTATLANYTSLATATDNCAIASVTQSPASGTSISGSGVVTAVTLTATDVNGNVSTCTFNVTTVDTLDPVFVSCPSNQNEAPDANCQFTLLDYTSLATVSDNCDAPATIVVTQSPAAGTVITGTTTITLTATDGSGNSSTCLFDVILADTTAPTITNCPSSMNVVANGSCSFTLPDYTSTVTTNDNCGGSSSVTVTQSPSAGTSIGTGSTTITLTATDGSGNTATCTFDVIVADTTAPVINCTSNITTCNPVVTYTAPTATDNCSGVSVAQTDATGLTSGSTFPVGTTTLEYTAIDASGNTSICTFDITVEAPPTPSVVGADLILCDTVSTATISGNTPTSGTGSWILLSGSGTFGNASSPTTTLSGIPVGVTEVVWMISNGSCTPSADTLVITMSTCFEIVIPTGFTPDGDGTNDVWDIPYLNLYHPNCTVQVFNRWGARLFESTGYANPWDGTFNGNKMPIGSYYFVIDLGDGSDIIKGIVTIIK